MQTGQIEVDNEPYCYPDICKGTRPDPGPMDQSGKAVEATRKTRRLGGSRGRSGGLSGSETLRMGHNAGLNEIRCRIHRDVRSYQAVSTAAARPSTRP